VRDGFYLAARSNYELVRSAFILSTIKFAGDFDGGDFDGD
jgi:hypothetical protein